MLSFCAEFLVITVLCVCRSVIETGKRFPVLFLQGSKHRPVFPDKAHAEQQLPTFRLTHPADKARYRVDFNRF